MAGDIELTSGIRCNSKIRAQGRVFFGLIQISASLIFSVTLHILALEWIAYPRHSPEDGAHQARFELSILSATLSPPSDSLQRTPAQAAKEPQENPTKKSPSKQPLAPPEVLPSPVDITESIYFPRNSLTTPPQLVQNVDLSPVAILAGEIKKPVILELFINEQGSIDKIDVQSNELDSGFDEKLRELLLQLKFTGGKISNTAVKSRIRIEVMSVEAPKPEKAPPNPK